MALNKQERRLKIKRRIRKKIFGTTEKPRMTVYRSNRNLFVQIIDDVKKVTIIAASSLEKEIADKKTTKTEQAKTLGKLIAEKAIKAGVKDVVFDRNGYLYHGRIKTLADAARENGLNI